MLGFQKARLRNVSMHLEKKSKHQNIKEEKYASGIFLLYFDLGIFEEHDGLQKYNASIYFLVRVEGSLSS